LFCRAFFLPAYGIFFNVPLDQLQRTLSFDWRAHLATDKPCIVFAHAKMRRHEYERCNAQAGTPSQSH
jgi:hypothetical protein